jgi:hypothetical protein
VKSNPGAAITQKVINSQKFGPKSFSQNGKNSARIASMKFCRTANDSQLISKQIVHKNLSDRRKGARQLKRNYKKHSVPNSGQSTTANPCCSFEGGGDWRESASLWLMGLH